MIHEKIKDKVITHKDGHRAYDIFVVGYHDDTDIINVTDGSMIVYATKISSARKTINRCALTVKDLLSSVKESARKMFSVCIGSFFGISLIPRCFSVVLALHLEPVTISSYIALSVKYLFY
jgi:hypothetical protein